MVISVPKISECAQHKCVNAGAFFGCLVLHTIFKPAPNVNVLAFASWFILCPNFQSAPKVNVLVLAHFLLLISVPKFSECTQGEDRKSVV